MPQDQIPRWIASIQDYEAKLRDMEKTGQSQSATAEQLRIRILEIEANIDAHVKARAGSD